MATPTRSSSSDRLRYRYGLCLNDQCEKCKAKEVQQIAARKDFVCAECGKPLRECPPPKKKTTSPVGLVIALAVVVIAALLAWGFWPSDEQAQEPPVDETVEQTEAAEEVTEPVVVVEDSVAAVEDTITVAEEPKEEPKEEPEAKKKEPKPAVLNGHGTVTLPYGVYTGDLKNGKPNGYGTVKYTQTHKIAASKDFVAEPGDTYEGEFRNGIPSGGRGYWNHKGDVRTINL